MRLTLCAFATIVVLNAVDPLNAQLQPTIPELIASERKDITLTALVGSGKPPTMPELLQRVERVVRGTIGRSRSYMAEDQRRVITEHEIIHASILFDSTPRSVRMPGAVEPVTATQFGGTVMIDGFQFTEVNEALPVLQPGTDVLLLLERKGSRYQLAGQVYGAFRVTGDQLTPLSKKGDFAKEYMGVRADAAQEKIVSIVRALRSKP